MSDFALPTAQQGKASIYDGNPGLDMETVHTDVFIVGAGPAGASLASFLGYYGIKGLVVSRDATTAEQPRAHITNGATFECLRDIGLEKEFRDVGLDNSFYGTLRISPSLAEPDFLRAYSFGKHPSRIGDYQEATPCPHADVSQNYAEPVLVKYASHHGFKFRFDCKFLSFTEDPSSGLITSTVEDQVTLRKFRVVSKFLCGADGTRSYVARQLDLPFQDSSTGSNALNVWYEADLSDMYRLNPGVLHSMSTPYMETPLWATNGVNRVIRPWTEFIMMMTAAGPGISNDVPREEIVARVKQMLGDDNIKIKIKGISRWKINESYAETISKGNVFCLGDAIHKHPPGNGLGSNTSIQDSYNLAWKLAYVLKGLAGPSLLDSYNAERQPMAKRIVKIANDSFRVHFRLNTVLGVSLPKLEDRVSALKALQDTGPEARERRVALRKAMEDREFETSGLGGEMNQKYASKAICLADESDSGPTWDEGPQGVFHHTISTFPGFRLPHAWLGNDVVGEKVSTHDLSGHGEFTIFTGIGGKESWSDAAQATSAVLGVKINVHSIGFGQDYSDMFYTWEDRREVEEDGAILVRPDRTIAWRSRDLSLTDRLLPVMQQILAV